MKARLFAVSIAVTCWPGAMPSASAGAGEGRAYFENVNEGRCLSCHYVDSRKLVGPGMLNVTQRHSEDWLREFLTDPQKTWGSDHSETQELKERVRKTRAPVTTCLKGPMTAGQLENLIAYLKTLEE